MPYGHLADAVVLVHLAFIAFVLFGAFAVAWRPKLAWLHLPAVMWGALVEWNAWVCPLTPWEQQLRAAAGQSGYAGGFVDRYLLPVLYPGGLTPRIQLVLAAVVIVVNVALYVWIISRHRVRGPAV